MARFRCERLIKGGCVVGVSRMKDVDIAIDHGKITAVAADIDERCAGDVIDARGLHILPGVIDSHVHLREPGLDHKEDFETGSRAAVLGGIVCVFDMPNTDPPLVREEDFHDKIERGRGRMFCDYAVYVGATSRNVDRLSSLEGREGCAGVKVFMGSSTGDLLVEDDDVIEAILRKTRGVVAVHSEHEKRLRERKHHLPQWAQWWGAGAHQRWRDVEVALSSTQRLVSLVRKTGHGVHIVHVTTEEELSYLSSIEQDTRQRISLEVTPHHVTFETPDALRHARDVLGSANYAVVNPPLRTKRHRQALWRALSSGQIDTIGSDHAPHSMEEKTARPYPHTPSGMTGLDMWLSVMLDHCHKGRLSLHRLVYMTSERVATLFALEGKGFIKEGYDADMTCVDLKARQRLDMADCASKAGWSMYHGMEVVGAVRMTIIRGHMAMCEGQILGDTQGKGIGRPCRFHKRS